MAVLNVSSGITQNSYDSILRLIDEKADELSAASMKNAAVEIKNETEITEDELTDATCMCDGTWQRRGHSSLVGAVVCISAHKYKVVDIEVLRKHCRVCQRLQYMDKASEEYRMINDKHCCSKNYDGSAGNMEVVGCERIFNRSVAERKLRYVKYIGDGDSKAYSSVAEKNPYGKDIAIEKLGCVGHVQKRVGARLRNLKKVTGNKKLLDGKTLGGKGRLTLKEIDKLQVYYGLAVRRNVGNVAKMKQDISAILRHRLSTDENPNHSLCPDGVDTWCKYKRNPLQYKHTNPLPNAVAVHIKPVFDRLSKDEPLNRCVEGYTQNAAESFNNLLWHFYPKNTFVGIVPLNISKSFAVIFYNEGYQKLDDLFPKLGLHVYELTAKTLEIRDHSRIYLANRNAQEKQKKIRKASRKRRLGWEDNANELEGTVYQTGSF